MSSQNRPGPNTAFWDARRGVIRTRKGGWRPGEGVFSHGYSMMDDLVGQASYMQVMILNATGRFPERRLADWFDAIHICLSWPDPRIWCNHVGALGGTARASAVAATTAGILSSDSRTYGIRPLLAGVAFIQDALARHRAGASAADIVTRECAKHGGKPHVMGYARPLATGDERVVAMERYSRELGFTHGPHLQLAYAIHDHLNQRFAEGINVNGYMSAFLSDQGFSPDDVYRTCAVLVTSGVTACFAEARDNPAGAFLPLRCDDIDYQGKAPRPVPEG